MSDNAFLAAVERYDFFTENGAVSHATTGAPLLDYFAKCSTYRGRSEADVDTDLGRMWNESPLLTLMIVFYSRLITRKPRGFAEGSSDGVSGDDVSGIDGSNASAPNTPTTETSAAGQGWRDEFRRALCWLERTHPEALDKNLWLVPVMGSWKDLWHEDVVDVLDAKRTYNLVERGMKDGYHRALVAKYLPRIRSKSNAHSERHKSLNRWAKGLCEHLGWDERAYRKFKSDPAHKAHQFQRDMCRGDWDAIDFGRIPGRALFKMSANTGKDGKSVMERRLLKRYFAWLDLQPTLKFTGYPFELLMAAKSNKLTLAQKRTFDKQFDGLLATAKEDRGGLPGNVWCALDTSGSMGAVVTGKATAFDICIGLGIFFAALNEGAFQDHVIMFDTTSRCMRLSGSFTEKVRQVVKANTAWGSTNFQSVIDEIVSVRRARPEVPLGDFPDTLIVVSDMQFNPTGDGNANTNYEEAMRKLAEVGLPKIRIVWWWVTGRASDFPSTMDDEGVIMIGGFDGSVLGLLLGDERGADQPTSNAAAQQDVAASAAKDEKSAGKGSAPTPAESMLKALNQEVLRQLRV